MTALPGKPAARPANNMTRLLLIAVVAIIVFGLLRGIFSHHDTAYEKLAGEMTVALQNNDLPAVEKFQNAETATHVTRGIVGHAADVFAPLGKLVRVRDGQTLTLAEAHFAWTLDTPYAFEVEVDGSRIVATVDGARVEANDDCEVAFRDGGVALIVFEGAASTPDVFDAPPAARAAPH